jgi:tetraacyldisaccharide 4'-kinase
VAGETVSGESRPATVRLWTARTPWACAARGALSPLALGYGAVVRLRNALYDTGALDARETAVPTVSVGNLSVGGTGKTPLASWAATELAARGHRPALVLRGYGGGRDGGDEALVHRILNPGVPVIAMADRVAGIAQAAAQGCDVAVLDDGFQHRRARRVADLVLVSADAWPIARWPLPAGPWREPLSALRRATTVIITRKMADRTAVRSVMAAVAAAAPDRPLAVAALVPDCLRTLDGATRPLSALRGARVRAVAAIGWPGAFFAQLAALGASIDAASYPDHHRFTPADVVAIRRRAGPGVSVICTLKDAVKLGEVWPREAGALWYVSQRVEFERGAESVFAALDAVRPLPSASAHS